MAELKSRFEWYITNGAAVDPINLYEFFIDHLPEFIRLTPHDFDSAVAKAIAHRSNHNNSSSNNNQQFNNIASAIPPSNLFNSAGLITTPNPPASQRLVSLNLSTITPNITPSNAGLPGGAFHWSNLQADPPLFLSRDECRTVYHHLIHRWRERSTSKHIDLFPTHRYKPNKFTIFLITMLFWLYLPLVFLWGLFAGVFQEMFQAAKESHANPSAAVKQGSASSLLPGVNRQSSGEKRRKAKNNGIHIDIADNHVIQAETPNSALPLIINIETSPTPPSANEESKLLSPEANKLGNTSYSSMDEFKRTAAKGAENSAKPTVSFAGGSTPPFGATRPSSNASPSKAPRQSKHYATQDKLLRASFSNNENETMVEENTTPPQRHRRQNSYQGENSTENRESTSLIPPAAELASQASYGSSGVEQENREIDELSSPSPNLSEEEDESDIEEDDDLSETEEEFYVNQLLDEEEETLKRNPTTELIISDHHKARLALNRSMSRRSLSQRQQGEKWPIYKSFLRFLAYVRYSYRKQLLVRGLWTLPVWLCFACAAGWLIIFRADLEQLNNAESASFLVSAALFILLDSLREAFLDYDDLLKRKFIQKFSYRLQRTKCVHGQVDSMVTLALQAMQHKNVLQEALPLATASLNLIAHSAPAAFHTNLPKNDRTEGQLRANAFQTLLPVEVPRSSSHGSSSIGTEPGSIASPLFEQLAVDSSIIPNHHNSLPLLPSDDESTPISPRPLNYRAAGANRDSTCSNDRSSGAIDKGIIPATALSVFEFVYRHRNTTRAKNRQRVSVLLAISLGFVHSCIPLAMLVILSPDAFERSLQNAQQTIFRIASVIANTAAFAGLLLVFFNGLNHWANFTRMLEELTNIAKPGHTLFNHTDLRLDLNHPSNVSAWIEARFVITRYMHSGSSAIQSVANFQRHLMLFCFGFLFFYVDVCADLFTKKFSVTQYEAMAIFDCSVLVCCIISHIILASRLNKLMKEHVHILRSQHFAIQRILSKNREIERNKQVRDRQIQLEAAVYNAVDGSLGRAAAPIPSPPLEEEQKSSGSKVSRPNMKRMNSDPRGLLAVPSPGAHTAKSPETTAPAPGANHGNNIASTNYQSRNSSDDVLDGSALEEFRKQLLLSILSDSAELLSSSIEVINEADAPIKFMGQSLTYSFLYSALGLFASILVVCAANFADFQI
jgi:hypothetical protein